MKETLIKNARIVTIDKGTFPGSVLIEDDRIKAIIRDGETIPSPADEAEVIDAQGMLLLSGVIDTHVHFRTPGLTHKADIVTESHAAAAGGVTSVMDMPNVKPQTTTQEALEEKLGLFQRDSLVNYALLLGATNDNLDVIKETPGNLYSGVKVFMGSSTGNMLVDRQEALRGIFKASKKVIVAHCEDQDIIARNTASLLERFGKDGDLPIRLHPEVRSAEACLRSTQKAIAMAKATGARLHVAHISTAQEMELFNCGDLKDKRVTAEVCLSHLMFEDTDFKRLGARIKCNPSVKSHEDKEALWKAIKDGSVDTIATDHAPHLIEEKQGGALKAMSGMPMVQFSLISVLEEAQKRDIPLETVTRLMSYNPARLFSLKDRGAIKEGYKADLVLVDRQDWTLTQDTILSKCQWSPLEGHQFSWKVRRTLVNGKTVFLDGTFPLQDSPAQLLDYDD